MRKLAICASIIMKGYILIKNLLHCHVLMFYGLVIFNIDVNVDVHCNVEYQIKLVSLHLELS